MNEGNGIQIGRQRLSLFGDAAKTMVVEPLVRAAVQKVSLSSGVNRGSFYTRREIAKLILDLAGYIPASPLYAKRLLDPCFGGGVFLLEAAARLLEAAKRDGKLDVALLGNALRGVEVGNNELANIKVPLRLLLKGYGFSPEDIAILLDRWFVDGDFLLVSLEGKFDYVVGNPPYLRLEAIDKTLLAEYRRRFATMSNRADLYIPFFERSLDLLGPNGTLGFICSDRWLKNQYGRELRKKIDRGFHLQLILGLQSADPFESKVSAYPALFLIRNSRPGRTLHYEIQSTSEAAAVLAKFQVAAKDQAHLAAAAANTWSPHKPARSMLLQEIESRLPLLEDAAIEVGIGIATGCDEVFIVDESQSRGIERERLTKLAMRDEIEEGIVRWHGKYVINTFEPDGRLIDLEQYPGTKRYLAEHKERLLARHVSRRNPKQWFRTIDKPRLAILGVPRLYIPDIMLAPRLAHVEEPYYPHHNLYWLTSQHWNLHALHSILRSAIAFLYIDTFSTKVRGGYYRYQAQTLRKIRVPKWEHIAPSYAEALIDLRHSPDVRVIDDVVSDLYGLSARQKAFLSQERKNHGTAFSRL